MWWRSSKVGARRRGNWEDDGKNDVDAAIAELSKLGTVNSSDWQSYTWQNELAEQKRRIL
jgi:hypothetical protein